MIVIAYDSLSFDEINNAMDLMEAIIPKIFVIIGNKDAKLDLPERVQKHVPTIKLDNNASSQQVEPFLLISFESPEITPIFLKIAILILSFFVC